MQGPNQDQTVEKENNGLLSKLKKHWKITVCTGALLLGLGAGAHHIETKKEGTPITTSPKEKIDVDYCRSLVGSNKKVKNLKDKRLTALLSKIHYLNTGRPLSEEGCLFNLYDDENLPLRARIFGKNKAGCAWGNRSTYVSRSLGQNFLEFFFHEMGHEISDNRRYPQPERSLAQIISIQYESIFKNTEPAAKKNELDSFVIFAGIDPDSGYPLYAKFNRNIHHNKIFDDVTDKHFTAKKLALLSYATGYKIEDVYKDGKQVRDIFNEATKDMTPNEFLRAVHKKALEKVEKRCKNEPNFEKNYKTLEEYFRLGTTGSSLDLLFIPRKEKEKIVQDIDNYLRNNKVSGIMKRNLKQAREEYMENLKDDGYKVDEDADISNLNTETRLKRVNAYLRQEKEAEARKEFKLLEEGVDKKTEEEKEHDKILYGRIETLKKYFRKERLFNFLNQRKLDEHADDIVITYHRKAC